MKQINISKDACSIINELRNGNGFEPVKAGIADSLSTLSNMISAGRDSEDISAWTDELMSVMYVLSEYNSLVNALYDTSDRKMGFYEFVDLRDNR